jgi:uncharacterized protein (TIGR03435 family)
MRRSILLVLLVLAATGSADRLPSFDVISIKPNHAGINAPGTFRFLPDGSVRVDNMPVRDVIRVAYSLQAYQMANWPAWTSTEHFDIQAKTASNTSQEQRLLMLRQLLATRFKLAVRTATHNGPTYDLILDRKDGRVGPRLTKSSADCTALRAKLPAHPLPPPPNAPLVVCDIRNLPGRVVALGVPVERLARTLTEIVGRPVVDQTQLNGSFDIELQYTPEATPSPQALPADSKPIDPNGPSIFTALREQLGLKLDFRRKPVDVLVIDHIERPTPN